MFTMKVLAVLWFIYNVFWSFKKEKRTDDLLNKLCNLIYDTSFKFTMNALKILFIAFGCWEVFMVLATIHYVYNEVFASISIFSVIDNTMVSYTYLAIILIMLGIYVIGFTRNNKIFVRFIKLFEEDYSREDFVKNRRWIKTDSGDMVPSFDVSKSKDFLNELRNDTFSIVFNIVFKITVLLMSIQLLYKIIFV